MTFIQLPKAARDAHRYAARRAKKSSLPFNQLADDGGRRGLQRESLTEIWCSP
jgi:hypothetical protein